MAHTLLPLIGWESLGPLAAASRASRSDLLEHCAYAAFGGRARQRAVAGTAASFLLPGEGPGGGCDIAPARAEAWARRFPGARALVVRGRIGLGVGAPPEHLRGIAAAAASLPCLEILHLDECGLYGELFAPVADVLASGAVPRLRELSIRYNGLGNAGAAALAGALAAGAAPLLERLDLYANVIDSRASPQLVAALRAGCPRLEALAVNNMPFGSEGFLALAEAVAGLYLPRLRLLDVRQCWSGWVVEEAAREALRAACAARVPRVELLEGA